MTKLFLCLLLACPFMYAAPILSGIWYGFEWDGSVPASTTGSNAYPATGDAGTLIQNPGASPWTISLAAGGSITVVDGFWAGDSFGVRSNGALLGTTSAGSFGFCGNDPVPCLAGNFASRGTFALNAGANSIEIVTAAGSFAAGTAFFRVDGIGMEIPEPRSWVLVWAGSLLIASLRRLRPARSTNTRCDRAGGC